MGQAFDASCPSPALLKEIREGRVPAGRALVPGCGRGYDVYALAADDRVVIGMELAQKAADAARELDHAKFSCESACPTNAKFEVGNFFDIKPSNEEEKFDFVYDYTFLCALDPSVRTDWAKQMSSIIKKDGVLMTLVFPICEKQGGPPFAVNLGIVEELLVNEGFEKLQVCT